MQYTLPDAVVAQIANELHQAERSLIPIEPISKRYSGMTIDDAYAIQLHNKDRALREGKKITGKKIGLTSLAMQQSLGVNQPDFGWLYDSMDATSIGFIPTGGVMQPRVEGELAFFLKQSLRGQVSVQEVLDATAYVVPAIEVVGSRIKDWKLTIVDTVADNASCGMYLLSNLRIDPRETDLKAIQMKLYRGGEFVNGGLGSAVMGDPAAAVAWLARCMGQYGVNLEAGDVVMSGALSAAVPAHPGEQFTCDFGPHGAIDVRFE